MSPLTMPDQATLAQRLRKARENARVTQETAAKALNRTISSNVTGINGIHPAEPATGLPAVISG